MSLKGHVLKLAYENQEIRGLVLPLLTTKVASEGDLEKRIIRLAYVQPNLRPYLLPAIAEHKGILIKKALKKSEGTDDLTEEDLKKELESVVKSLGFDPNSPEAISIASSYLSMLYNEGMRLPISTQKQKDISPSYAESILTSEPKTKAQAETKQKIQKYLSQDKKFVDYIMASAIVAIGGGLALADFGFEAYDKMTASTKAVKAYLGPKWKKLKEFAAKVKKALKKVKDTGKKVKNTAVGAYKLAKPALSLLAGTAKVATKTVGIISKSVGEAMMLAFGSGADPSKGFSEAFSIWGREMEKISGQTKEEFEAGLAKVESDANSLVDAQARKTERMAATTVGLSYDEDQIEDFREQYVKSQKKKYKSDNRGMGKKLRALASGTVGAAMFGAGMLLAKAGDTMRGDTGNSLLSARRASESEADAKAVVDDVKALMDMAGKQIEGLLKDQEYMSKFAKEDGSLDYGAFYDDLKERNKKDREKLIKGIEEDFVDVAKEELETGAEFVSKSASISKATLIRTAYENPKARRKLLSLIEQNQPRYDYRVVRQALLS